MSDRSNTTTLDHELLNQYHELDQPGEPSTVSLLAEKFFSISEERVSNLDQAIRNQDPKKVRHEAHAFKSSSGNVGAKRLSDLCKNLELMGESESLESAPETYELLKTELHEVKTALNQYLSAL